MSLLSKPFLSFGPLFLTSIDPGFRNCGLAFVCVVKDKAGQFDVIIDGSKTRTYDLGIDLEGASIDVIDRNVKSLFWKVFSRPAFLQRSMVLVEEQYFNVHKPKTLYLAHWLSMLNQALFTCLSAHYGCLVLNIPSSQAKRSLGIVNDDSQKSKTCAYVKSIIGEDVWKELNNPSHHCADAFIYIHKYIIDVMKQMGGKKSFTGGEDLSKAKIVYRVAKPGEMDELLKLYDEPLESTESPFEESKDETATQELD
jgi:hypothetical protein